MQNANFQNIFCQSIRVSSKIHNDKILIGEYNIEYVHEIFYFPIHYKRYPIKRFLQKEEWIIIIYLHNTTQAYQEDI